MTQHFLGSPIQPSDHAPPCRLLACGGYLVRSCLLPQMRKTLNFPAHPCLSGQAPVHFSCLGANVGRSRVGLTLGPRYPCLDSLPEHAEGNTFSDHLSVRLQCQARAVPGRPGPAPHLPAPWRHRHSHLLPVALAHLQPQPYHQAAVRCLFPDCA